MAADELIPIVDESDQLVGTATRKEAQSKGLFHRVARVLVYDESKRILLQRRASNLDTWPNCWDNSAAGHVDVGESYETAAQRELNEELGVEGSLENVAIYKEQGMLGNRILNRFNAVFKIQLSASTQFNVQADEVSEVRWFSIDEIGFLIQNSPELVTSGVVETFKYLSTL